MSLEVSLYTKSVHFCLFSGTTSVKPYIPALRSAKSCLLTTAPVRADNALTEIQHTDLHQNKYLESHPYTSLIRFEESRGSFWGDQHTSAGSLWGFYHLLFMQYPRISPKLLSCAGNLVSQLHIRYPCSSWMTFWEIIGWGCDKGFSCDRQLIERILLLNQPAIPPQHLDCTSSARICPSKKSAEWHSKSDHEVGWSCCSPTRSQRVLANDGEKWPMVSDQG